jgi:hypothetical protein|tara:strand:+ start:2843 stop:3013 length:171 start_codon:yes stop_codon:yes gene_type:complete
MRVHIVHARLFLLISLMKIGSMMVMMIDGHGHGHGDDDDDDDDDDDEAAIFDNEYD